RSAKDKNAAYTAQNKALRLLNKAAHEGVKILKALEREDQLRRRNEILALMIKMMREKGASDREIRKKLPGIAEFAKILYKTGGNQVSSKSGNPPPSPAADEEALGFLLSEVERQEVHWLWEKRLPLGKITILDGDPDMGKSLLAIHLAACVSTGSPMPD